LGLLESIIGRIFNSPKDRPKIYYPIERFKCKGSFPKVINPNWDYKIPLSLEFGE